MVKPVELRRRAARDVDDAVDLREAGGPVASRSIDPIEQAFGHLSRHPLSGSLRYAHELDIPDLRAWPLRGFPHVIFYVDTADHLDVWRVLHAHSDIPAWLAAADPRLPD